MKKLIRISLSMLLFALAVAVLYVPAGNVSAELSVSSESDFQVKDHTLVKYTGTAQVVSVPAYIKCIGEEAFAGHEEIVEVKFHGDKLEEIAYCAFAGCNGLEKVVIPNSVITLGNGAFSRCDSLEEVSLGSNVKDIGIGCFANCPKLSNLTVDSKNPYLTVKDGCLYDDEIKRLYLVLPGREKDYFQMPSTVENIEAYAFWGSKDIKNIGFSAKLKTIPDYAFSNCKALEEVTIPLSVRRIGIKAFEDCIHLKKAVIPISVTEIHSTAFDGCKRLEIIAEQDTYAYRYYQDFLTKNEILGEEEQEENIHVEEPVVVPDEGYYDPDKDNILGGTFVIGNSAIVFLDGTKAVNINQNLTSNTTGTKEEPNDNEVYIEKNKDIPKFTIYNSILADYAFYKDSSLREYEFEEEIEEIGRFSFARSNLEKVHIPFGVTKIGYASFYHCDRLVSVFIPGSVKEIAPKAFDETPWLKNWRNEAEEDFLIVGDGILLAYKGKDSQVVIPENVKTIGSYAFEGNDFITGVTIPQGVETIGEGAFYNCKNLQLLEGGENIKKIKDKAFLGCAFSEFYVRSTVKELGFHAIDPDIITYESEEIRPGSTYEDTATYLDNHRVESFTGGVDAMYVKNTSSFIEKAEILIDDIEGSYILELSDLEEDSRIKEAFQKVYRTQMADALPCVDITLIEEIDGIPVKYFGDRNVELKLKLPKGYLSSSLRVLTLDANGQLENVSYKIEDEYLLLSVKHLSPFVFMATDSADNLYGKGTVYGGQTVITGFQKLDPSPDTADRTPIRAILALALVSLGIANLFVKRKEKNK